MGYLVAQGFAEHADLETGLRAHLVSNFHPPLPGEYLDTIVEALFAVIDGQGEAIIDLPNVPLIPRNARVRSDGTKYLDAESIVDVFRAEAFLAAAAKQVGR